MSIFDKLRAISKQQLFSAIGLLLLFVLFLVPRYANQQAKQRAVDFCNSVQVGESLQSLLTKCTSAQGKCASWESVDGVARHQAWFDGFLLNAYECEIRTKNEKVFSKFFEEHTD